MIANMKDLPLWAGVLLTTVCFLMAGKALWDLVQESKRHEGEDEE